MRATAIERCRWLILLSLVPLMGPPAPGQPAAIVLDGVRDPGYVLVAEDAAGDLAPSVNAQPKFQWADLTRLYLASDSEHLYVFVELPYYTQANSSGEIGLAILLNDGTATGPRTDPLQNRINLAYSHSTSNLCDSEPLAQLRHPDVLIRGYLDGVQDGANTNSGVTLLFVGGGSDWQSGDEWGGIGPGQVDRIDYADGQGVELHIPWAHLGQAGPVNASISFFSTARPPTGDPFPANFDAVPPDVQAAAALTDTTMSQLTAVKLPLPQPGSVALGCGTASVDEGAGSVMMAARLHTVLTQTVAVSYTATALTAGAADFAAQSGTITFAPGVTRQVISVPVMQDQLVEGPESFRLTLSNAGTLALAEPYTATIIINDDDSNGTARVFMPLISR